MFRPSLPSLTSFPRIIYLSRKSEDNLGETEAALEKQNKNLESMTRRVSSNRTGLFFLLERIADLSPVPF